MASYIGIDTSNYRTSVCILFEDGYKNVGRLLPVEQGKAGLRQSDALFLHTRALPEVLAELPKAESIAKIGVSTRPRDEKGSYMPCFLAGAASARSMAYASGAPVYETSHQAGHTLAGIYENKELLSMPEFITVHLSGGTSEILHVKNDMGALNIIRIGGTLDINAGQLIDRAGVMLGLRFPCGAELEELAKGCPTDDIKVKTSVKGTYFNLSGHQNIIEKMFGSGEEPKKIASYAIKAVTDTILSALNNQKTRLPVLFVGGVSANGYLREVMKRELSYVYFVSPALSGDNALGCAYGAYLSDVRRK
ncbi:MAG: hypothetical protein IJG50_03225 [Clostridia bacterium]|nr:hypothetical protein [Clostridia bacterium]